MTLRERLAAIPYTGAISDILDEMGLREQVLPHEIQSLRPGQIVAGCALTVLGEPAAGLARSELNGASSLYAHVALPFLRR